MVLKIIHKNTNSPNESRLLTHYLVQLVDSVTSMYLWVLAVINYQYFSTIGELFHLDLIYISRFFEQRGSLLFVRRFSWVSYKCFDIKASKCTA